MYMYVPLLFSNSGVGSFTTHKNQQISESVVKLDLYGFSSSSEKTEKSDSLRMLLQGLSGLNP